MMSHAQDRHPSAEMARTALSDISARVQNQDLSGPANNVKRRDNGMKAQTLVKSILERKVDLRPAKSVRRKREEKLTRLSCEISKHNEACLIRAKIAETRNGLGQRMGEVLVATSKKKLEGIAAEMIQVLIQQSTAQFRCDSHPCAGRVPRSSKKGSG